MNSTLPPPQSGATALNLQVGRAGQLLAARVVRCPQPALGCVVLLHGLASNCTRWSELMAATTLGSRWHLLAPDLRGHGESQPAGKSTLEDWCDDLVELLKAVEENGSGRIVLVGHSLGAQVALHFVANHPQRVASLVLIDPVFRAALAPRWARIARAAPLFRVAAAAVRGLNAIGLRRARVVPDDLRALDLMAREALRDPASEAAFVQRYSSTRADLRQFRTAQYLQDLVEMFRHTPALDRIEIPVLAMLSSGATFAQPEAMHALLKQMPRVEMKGVECHHWPLTEKPVEVRTAIEAWCDRQSGCTPVI